MKPNMEQWCRKNCSMFEYCIKDGTEYLSMRCKNISCMTDKAFIDCLSNR